MTDKLNINGCTSSRRDFMRKGLHGIGMSAALPFLLNRTSSALAAETLAGTAANPDRILVVIELSGGNDGLNTVVPIENDDYYRRRPSLGIPKDKTIQIDEQYGLHPSLTGFEELYKEGQMAIVHGCGYDNPSLSHFTSMGFWHTGVPNGGEAYGWLGRMVDNGCPQDQKNLLVNIADRQALAVKSKLHTPLVFNDPRTFVRRGEADQSPAFAELSEARQTGNDSRDFLRSVAANAAESSAFVRDAIAAYQTPVDYGVTAGLAGDLRKVAALIHAGMPTRVYYVSFGGNAFDTHVHQADLHTRLLMYTADGVRGFMRDLKRIGRADDVAVMMFTEFGRRVEENASGGTDHGTATPMFVLGSGVNGGLYGQHPSLTDLDDGNLKMTTDFRRIYATMVEDWMKHADTKTLLKGEYAPLNIFA